MAVLAFLSSALYWPGVAGAATTPRWALFAAVIPWLLKPQHFTISHFLGGLFIVWAFITMFWDASRLDGIGQLAILLICACCFCLGAQTKNLRKVYIGAAVGIGVSSVFAIIQCFGYAPEQDITAWLGFAPLRNVVFLPSGLFVNCNLMGEAAALVLIALVSERMWLLIPIVAPALIISEARGAMVAVIAALLVHYRKWWPVLLPIVVTLGAMVVFRKDFASINERWLIWKSTVDGLTVFGHGIGSYWNTYPIFDLRPKPVSGLPEYAHNEFLHYFFELGIPGLVLFVAFCASFYGPINTARLVLIALLVEACFEFPIHEPTTVFLGLVAAGHAVRCRYLLGELPSPLGRSVATWRYRSQLWERYDEAASGGTPHALRSSHS